MKVTVPISELENTISRAEKITAKNTSLPVLKCVLLSADKDKLDIRTTNLDLGMVVSIRAIVKESGAVAVPADALNSFLSSSRGRDSVSLFKSGGNLEIKTSKETVKLRIYEHGDFPSFPVIKGEPEFDISAGLLAKGLKAVWYSASVSSMKPELSSVLLNYSDGTLVFAATDSFRLAEKKISIRGISDLPGLLIPIKNVGEMIRNLEFVDKEEKAKISFNNNQMSLRIGDTHITSRIVDGTFPDYKQIIPKSFVTEAVILKQDLVDALRVSNVFVNRFNQVTIKASPRGKKFILETSNPERGESVVVVAAALSGEEVEVNFNYKYITDSFQALNTDSITLNFSGVGKPLVITGVGDTTFTYLVMPMNR